MEMYSLFDRSMKEYGTSGVTLAANDATVVRALVDGVREARGSIHERHPEDFDLMHVGHFDHGTGVVTPQVPRLVGNLAKFMSGGDSAGS